jgi:tetratricopeptide (TPR) repeat protein
MSSSESEPRNRFNILNSLNKPIHLYGLLLLITETLFIILLQQYKNAPFGFYFGIATIIVPIVFGILFFVLFTKYPHVNLSPDSFADQESYMKLFKLSNKISDVEKTLKADISTPFGFVPENISQLAPQEIDIYVRNLEEFFNRIDSKQLIRLHNWLNANNNHKLALICMDIAIAKGDIESMHYSFRSASLRKLGRSIEALHSAKLSIQLDQTNIDGYYNIARALLIMGNRQDAIKYIDHIDKHGSEKYISNIHKYSDIENS